MFPSLCLPVGVTFPTYKKAYEKHQEVMPDELKAEAERKKAAAKRLLDEADKADVQYDLTKLDEVFKGIDKDLEEKLTFLQKPLDEGHPAMNEVCSICVEPLRGMGHEFPGFNTEDQKKEVDRLSACGHFFHTNCIAPWLRSEHTTCPVCRTDVTVEDAVSFRRMRPYLGGVAYEQLPMPSDEEMPDSGPPQESFVYAESDEESERWLLRVNSIARPPREDRRGIVMHYYIQDMIAEHLRRWKLSGLVAQLVPYILANPTLEQGFLQGLGELPPLAPTLVPDGPTVVELFALVCRDGHWTYIFGHWHRSEVDDALTEIVKSLNSDAVSQASGNFVQRLYEVVVALRNVRVWVSDASDQSETAYGPSDSGVTFSLISLAQGETTQAKFEFLKLWLQDRRSDVLRLSESDQEVVPNIFDYWCNTTPMTTMRISCLELLFRVQPPTQPQQDAAFANLTTGLESYRENLTVLMSRFLALLPGVSSEAQYAFFDR